MKIFSPKIIFKEFVKAFFHKRNPLYHIPSIPSDNISIAFSVPCIYYYCTIISSTSTFSNLQLNGFNASTVLHNKHNNNSVLPTNSQVSQVPNDEIKLLLNKCNQCLLRAKNSSVKRVAHFNRQGSFVTHVLCPECHERVHGSGSEIFFTVKTARAIHKSRLSLLLFTWIQTANSDQVITDNNYLLITMPL